MSIVLDMDLVGGPGRNNCPYPFPMIHVTRYRTVPSWGRARGLWRTFRKYLGRGFGRFLRFRPLQPVVP